MDIKPIASNTSVPTGPRVADTGNFSNDLPSVAANQTATPVQTTNAVRPASETAPPQQTEEAVKQINEALKKLSQNLEFSIDNDLEKPVVKVVDQQTKEVIRQIPTEEALEIAKALDRVQGLLIKEKA